MLATIVLVGRPNVGKSTLFNRLTKSRAALVADMPGLTRDRQYGMGQHGQHKFILVDTGGFEPLVSDGVMYQMARQTETAISEADVVIFIVDGKLGVTPQDKAIADKLRVFNKPVYVAINKVEGVDQVIATSDFYALGLENLIPISASHGEGVAKLLHEVLAPFVVDSYDEDEEDEDDIGVTFAVVGRPNVGKSTLVNAILGCERMITFDEAGTTRDSINIQFIRDDKQYTIVDTAGIRRRSNVEDKIEKFSILKALQAISDVQVVVLVLDAHLDIAAQDATIVNYALTAGKSIVIAVNKWDNLTDKERMEIKATLARKLYFLEFAKINYISALQRRGIDDLMGSIDDAYTAAFTKMPTPKLTRILLEATKRQAPAYKGTARPKMRYAHQGGMNPPVIVIHGNSLDLVSKSYSKYLERLFRKAFNLIGTPLRIEYKTNENNPFRSKS